MRRQSTSKRDDDDKPKRPKLLSDVVCVDDESPNEASAAPPAVIDDIGTDRNSPIPYQAADNVADEESADNNAADELNLTEVWSAGPPNPSDNTQAVGIEPQAMSFSSAQVTSSLERSIEEDRSVIEDIPRSSNHARRDRYREPRAIQSTDTLADGPMSFRTSSDVDSDSLSDYPAAEGSSLSDIGLNRVNIFFDNHVMETNEAAVNDSVEGAGREIGLGGIGVAVTGARVIANVPVGEHVTAGEDVVGEDDTGRDDAEGKSSNTRELDKRQ